MEWRATFLKWFIGEITRALPLLAPSGSPKSAMGPLSRTPPVRGRSLVVRGASENSPDQVRRRIPAAAPAATAKVGNPTVASATPGPLNCAPLGKTWLNEIEEQLLELAAAGTGSPP